MKLARYCYFGMFSGCTSLTKAPVLPAKYLNDRCYYAMFRGCTSLNFITALFISYPYGEITFDWLYGVATTGIFVKSKDATWDVRGGNGIPEGWTVEIE